MVHTSYGTDWKYSYYLFGVKGSYHFNEELKITNPKLDVYGGASIFYRGYSVKYTGIDNQKTKASAGGMAIAIHAGARYFFSSSIGGFAELGYGISPLQLGLAIRF